MGLKNYTTGNAPLGSVFLVLCSLVVSCATTEDIGRVRWEMTALKSEVKQIRQKSNTMETQLPGQTKEIDKKIQELEDRQNATAKTVSDLLINVQTMTSEFQVLTGRFEEARYFSEKSTNEVLGSREMLVEKMNAHEIALNNLEKRLAQLSSEMAVKEQRGKQIEDQIKEEQKKADKDRTPKPRETDKAEGKGVLGAEVKDVYMEAYQAYRDGNSEKAREQFMSILNKYPENDYSDNARFWVAESHYSEGSYEDAILAYEELFKKNPESDKVPGAMLKQGLAFYALKDNNTGKIVLEKLIEKYPDSEQARLARKKINKLVPPRKR